MADPIPVDWRGASKRVFGTPRGRRLYLIVAGFVLVLVAYNTCYTYIRPSEVGIKQIIVGANKGIRSEVYYPGLHWVTPGTERMLTFPTHIQLLNLTNDANERTQDDERMLPALNIQTSEGYAVTVDTSVLYRVENPYKVLTTMGPGHLYEDSLVIPRAEQILRKRLGELDAEEFYNAVKRADKVRASLEDLNAEIVPNGVRAVQIFLRRYVYDGRYQQAIEQRKIQDQTVFKNKAEADMAQAAAERDKTVAIGEAAMKVELSRGDAEKRKIDAEADTYLRKQHAAGELEVKLAEAEGTRLENEALRGAGSENMVGLKMADVLKGTKLIIVPTDGDTGMNPLDLKAALRKFDVQGAP